MGFQLMRMGAVCLMGLLAAGAVAAAPLVSLEQGLAPLRQELAAIEAEQVQLNSILQAAEVSALERARAYRRYLQTDARKQHLRAEVESAEALAGSPNVIF